MKRTVLAAAVVALAALGATSASAAPAACLTVDVSVNGEAAPVNGAYCTPELPAR